MGIEVAGPKFQIESDKAFIFLGVSEREEVGEYWARVLDERRIFRSIDIVPLSKRRSYEKAGLNKAVKSATALTHSAGIIGVKEALQVAAFNPPEPVKLPTLVKRAMFDVPNEPIEAEQGAHETDFADMVKAGLEMAHAPVVTWRATHAIARGYSAVEHLAAGAENFPAGRAIIHSELDMYGFAGLADLGRAATSGVTTVMLPGLYHNEILFRPQAMTDMLTPAIFPEA